MRAKYIHENHVGDRRKHLDSGEVFTVTDTNNLNGNGDLFIKNENTGEVGKCFSRDWNDMRQYSTIILEGDLEFNRNLEPEEALNVGKHRRFKIGDQIRFFDSLKQRDVRNPNTGEITQDDTWWEPAEFFHGGINKHHLYIVVKASENFVDVKQWNRDEDKFTLINTFTVNWFAENKELWKQIHTPIDSIEESTMNFNRKGNVYTKMKLGENKYGPDNLPPDAEDKLWIPHNRSEFATQLINASEEKDADDNMRGMLYDLGNYIYVDDIDFDGDTIDDIDWYYIDAKIAKIAKLPPAWSKSNYTRLFKEIKYMWVTS